MSDYIERQRLKEAISADCQHLSYFDESFFDMVMNDVDEVPAANVREDVRGEWEFPTFLDSDENDPRCICSVCGSIETPLARHKFCPNCGCPLTDSAWDMLERRLAGHEHQ